MISEKIVETIILHSEMSVNNFTPYVLHAQERKRETVSLILQKVAEGDCG